MDKHGMHEHGMHKDGIYKDEMHQHEMNQNGMHKHAVIISNGHIESYESYKKYLDGVGLIICADGGAHHARRLGVMPHLLIGDFDSVSPGDLEHFKDAGVEVVEFPVEKDMTDTELAVEIALERGYREVVIIGGTGTRLDHTLANIFLLKKLLDAGARGIVADDHNEIMLVDRKVALEREANTKVTLLALTEKVEGITTKGLYYPLDNAQLHFGSSLGVSNEFVEDTAEISLTNGLLLVIKARD